MQDMKEFRSRTVKLQDDVQKLFDEYTKDTKAVPTDINITVYEGIENIVTNITSLSVKTDNRMEITIEA